MTDVEGVLAANQAFYDAHEQRDLSAMAALWADDDKVVCTHPGWPSLRGREAVLGSWQAIFQGPGRNQFILTEETVSVVGDMAWVALYENLVDTGSTTAIAATNVFERQNQRWRLVNHHGSPVMTSG